MPRQGRVFLGLLGLGLAFLLWRMPSMWREPGWQDEECYAIPGLTILQTGVPQLPPIPSRNPRSVFYRADEVVFLEPPLSFYVQAAFYAVLPKVHGTARLASALAGVCLIFLTGWLAVRRGVRPSAVLWGMGLLLMSRWFYFGAITARPDVLCSACGAAALLFVDFWTRTSRRRWLIAAGVAVGCGGLMHPFALAYAVQVAVWTALAARGRERIVAPLTVGLVAVLVASSWLILIIPHPETFETQFRNQFVHDRGGPVIPRLLWPWESLLFHARFLWPHLGPWQFLLAMVGAAAGLVLGRIDRDRDLMTLGWLAASAGFLIAVLVGPHHPVFGYFTYFAALAFVGVGCVIDRILRRVAGMTRRGPIIAAVLGLCAVLSFLPGSRIRMQLAYLRNWNAVEFNAPRFAQDLLARLPADATYVVDEEFVLDFFVAGRHTIAQRAIAEKALPPPAVEYDYRIASRSTDRYFKEMKWDDEWLWSVGAPDDPYACFAHVFRRTRKPHADFLTDPATHERGNFQ